MSGRRGSNGELTEALEMYLKVIYEIESESGSASVTDIAERLGVRSPSVTAALQRLADMDMVGYEKYRAVTLTKKGRTIAKRLLRTHDVLRELFVILGVDEDTAEEDACEIEHMIHPATFKRLAAFLRFMNSSDKGRRLIEEFRNSQ